jgi:Cys-tRNA(Pro)/Cys-tRNA(Cys) deacylase
MTSTPVTRALDELAIPYTLHEHAGPVHSLEQAARERGLQPGQVVRSLVFRTESGSFVMLMIPGQGRASWPKLRQTLGVSRVTTATRDELLRVTGYEPGAVSPFGLPQPLHLLADRGLLEHEMVSIGAGIRNAGILLRSADLIRALSPELGDFRDVAPAP